MDGYQFEEFLCELFATLGYTVEGTKKSGDQGADLFITQRNIKIVVQAKNYSRKVSNLPPQRQTTESRSAGKNTQKGFVSLLNSR